MSEDISAKMRVGVTVIFVVPLVAAISGIVAEIVYLV